MLAIDAWADVWLKIMGAVLWQSVLLVALAALVAWLLRRFSPALRYWLWQIVAIKLLLMPFWTYTIPLSFWPERVPPTLSEAIRPAANFTKGPGPVVSPDVSRLAEGRGRGAAREAVPLWESLGTITWQAWLLLAWFAVVLGQCVRLSLQHLRLAALLRRGHPASEDLAELVAELAGELGLRRVPAVVSVDGDCPLFVCGLFQARLVLPSRLIESLKPAERRQVVLHELAHVKRHDLAWGWPMELARIFHFFNPVIYWAGHQLRLERELCCDQLAMARSGHAPAEYAQTLVQVVSHASEPAAIQAAGIAAGLNGNNLSNKKLPSPAGHHEVVGERGRG